MPPWGRVYGKAPSTTTVLPRGRPLCTIGEFGTFTAKSIHAFKSPSVPKNHMPNIASILKVEISRIARKEVRGETQSLKKAVASYRTEIASLKRRAKDLEDQVRQLNKAGPKAKLVPEAETITQVTRFSAKALAAQRRRLKLSADRLGLLIGVSGQSVYNWEQGTTSPHAKYLPAIAALKTLSVRQAEELVEARRK
jgi:DNA-binding transcriptional regulator YiaG